MAAFQGPLAAAMAAAQAELSMGGEVMFMPPCLFCMKNQ
jgi:hypothetical protein